MIDLKDLGTKQESVKMELLHPRTNEVLIDENGVPFTISLLSADTNKYKSEFNKVIRESRDVKHELTAREQEMKACRLLADVTTGCYMIFDGKPFVFSAEAMADLYLNPQYTWIREQVEAFIRDRSNFI